VRRRRRRTSSGGRNNPRRRRIVPQSDDTSRADAALERIAAAKEDAAKSQKFAVLLSNRQQLTCPQRAAVAAIADTFIDSFLPAQPRPADTEEDDDITERGRRWEPMPTSDSDAEGSHAEAGL